MDISNLIKIFPFLAILAPIFLFWGTIREIGQKIFNLFVVEMHCTDIMAKAISLYIKNHAKSISTGYYDYSGAVNYLKPLKRKAAFGFKEIANQGGIYFVGKKPILITQQPNDDKKSGRYYDSRVKIFFFRGLFNADQLAIEAMDEYNKEREKISRRFFIEVITGMGNKTIINGDNFVGIPQAKGNSEASPTHYIENILLKYSIDDLGYGDKNQIPYVFCKQSSKILEEVEFWAKSRDWYNKRGILWRRGVLLYGIPGSGKSSAIRAIAQKLDLPVFIFDLASLSNMEFIQNWQNMQASAPCIALFEDIDTIFNKRENTIGENGGGLSFDCLLNAIGGTLPSEGVFTFVTTNNIDKLDCALGTPTSKELSSRPGRLDSIYEMNHVIEEDRMKIANRILFDFMEEEVQKIVSENREVTAAQFIELCHNLALSKIWK